MPRPRGLPYYVPPEIIIEELYRVIEEQEKEIEELRAELFRRTEESIKHSKVMVENMVIAALESIRRKEQHR